MGKKIDMTEKQSRNARGEVVGMIPTAKALSPESMACVDLLKQVLADALQGQVTSLAIVACGPNGFGPAIAGPQAPELNLGLDACKQQILKAVLTPQPQTPSRILRPGR